ncbi:hypothetical protein OIU35_32730 [Boseaceae bacterium BT-24-1]|nr:hypothetical protein [Boseaceae bacterium BT-24-1]
MGAEVVRARFNVVATHDQVMRFRRAIGDPGAMLEDAALPKTFPILWLADPRVQRFVRRRLPVPAIPVHIGQDFIYVSDLYVERTYRLELRIHVGDAASNRWSLRIRADAIDPRTGLRQATIVATFLLIRLAG